MLKSSIRSTKTVHKNHPQKSSLVTSLKDWTCFKMWKQKYLNNTTKMITLKQAHFINLYCIKMKITQSQI